MDIFKIMLGQRILFLSIIIFLVIKQEFDYKEFLVGFISIMLFCELLTICYITEVLGEIFTFISRKTDIITNFIVTKIKKIVKSIL